MKRYQRNDIEHEVFNYPLSHFKKQIRNKLETEIILEECERDKDVAYCWEWDEGIDKEDCGRLQCNRYQPRNGKSGCCKHLSPSYSGTGKFFKLTKEGLKPYDSGLPKPL